MIGNRTLVLVLATALWPQLLCCYCYSGANLVASASGVDTNVNTGADLVLKASGSRASSVLVDSSNNGGAEQVHLVPLSALDAYPEGGELRLFCAGQARPRHELTFEWLKDGEPLLSAAAATSSSSTTVDGSNHGELERVTLDRIDGSSSMLRVHNLSVTDTGNYTCVARSSHAHDSSSVAVRVLVRLRWIKEPRDTNVRLGRQLLVECDIVDGPGTRVTWTRLRDGATWPTRTLRIERTTLNDSGLYECKAVGASAHVDHLQQSQQQLSKTIKVTVTEIGLFSAV
ncbi:Hemicentin-2, partial [Fragariocoptes setiger]